jgi:hypothetical protein
MYVFVHAYMYCIIFDDAYIITYVYIHYITSGGCFGVLRLDVMIVHIMIFSAHLSSLCLMIFTYRLSMYCMGGSAFHL